jgi:hypothetical protein
MFSNSVTAPLLVALLAVLPSTSAQCLGTQLLWAGTCVNFCPGGTISSYINGTEPCANCLLGQWSQAGGYDGVYNGWSVQTGGCATCYAPSSASWEGSNYPGTMIWKATCKNGYYASVPTTNATCQAAGPKGQPPGGNDGGGFYTNTPACLPCPAGQVSSVDRTTCISQNFDFGTITMSSYLLAPTQLVRVPSSNVDLLVVDAFMNKIETYRMRDFAGSLPPQGGSNGFSFFWKHHCRMYHSNCLLFWLRWRRSISQLFDCSS